MLELIQNKKYAEVRRRILEMNEVDLANFITEMEDNIQAVIVFRLLPKKMAAEVFAYMEGDIRQRIVETISDAELSGIIEELFLDDTVDFLEEMPTSIVRRVIKVARPETRKQINQLFMYPEASAGSLMTTELLLLDNHWTVDRAIVEVRKQSEDVVSIDKLFVTDSTRHLLGTVALREVLASPDRIVIEELMETDVITVTTHTDQADVAELFKKYDLLSLPVVDTENRLVGLITIDDVVDVMEEEVTEDIYKMAAMAPNEEEYLQTSVFALAKKRVVWLLVLMISATFTGIIMERFSTALSVNVLLAYFIPMLMDTCGNAGSQASVSIIRSLVLNEVSFKDIFRVIWKEFRVSLLVGLGVSVLNFFRIWLLNHDPVVAAVVSFTLMISVIAAKFVGCVLPMIASRLKMDPAIMASPMITTIVDAITLIVYFNIATLLLPGM